jgi:thiol-disulfide isomerase/thioredoxin
VSRRKRLPVLATVVPVTLAALLSVTLAACGRDVPSAASVGVETIAPSDREPLPAIAGSTMDGSTLDLADLRGRVVVLNAWASWCEPCREEVPAFVALADAADPADVAVVGLDVADEPAAAADFVEEFAMAYPSLVDGEGSILPTIPGVPPKAIPSTVIVDRQGRIAARIVGGTSTDRLAGLVADVAEETTASVPETPAE